MSQAEVSLLCFIPPDSNSRCLVRNSYSWIDWIQYEITGNIQLTPEYEFLTRHLLTCFICHLPHGLNLNQVLVKMSVEETKICIVFWILIQHMIKNQRYMHCAGLATGYLHFLEQKMGECWLCHFANNYSYFIVSTLHICFI